jgi:hypothetical protein
MATYPCHVSFDFGWEEDDGVPRGVGLEEEKATLNPAVHIYGQLDIVLTHESGTYEPHHWDLADGLN